jgi:hypothetical protein
LLAIATRRRTWLLLGWFIVPRVLRWISTVLLRRIRALWSACVWWGVSVDTLLGVRAEAP